MKSMIMKNCLSFIFWILFASICSLAFAQFPDKFPYKDGREWQKETFSCMAPMGWGMDSYHCFADEWCGLIIYLIAPKVTIIVYENSLAKMQDGKHDQIQFVDWDPLSNTPTSYTSASGIVFEGFEGQWKNAEILGHKVLRLDTHKGDDYVRIFIFGKPEDMASQVDKYQWFLDHFKWK
jgi:hypothetical protein